MALLNFDARQVQPDTGVMDPIPAAWYNIAMTKSENKPTSTGTGSMLVCEYTVLDGQYAGRKLFDRFNLVNQNPQAVEIAYKQLSAVMHACGVLTVGDSSEMHNRPMKAKVKVKPAAPKMANGQPTGEMYEANNEISAYRNINDTSMNAAPGAAPGAPAGFAPPPAAVPAAQTWAPPPVAAAPMAPPAQQQWTPPAAPAAAPGAPPQWQPPAGAPAQPWAAPAQAPAAPAAAPAMPPAGMPQPWSPPPVAGAAPGQAVQPPWMTPPPAQ